MISSYEADPLWPLVLFDGFPLLVQLPVLSVLGPYFG